MADFTKRTGIKVKVRSADEATLANQIIQEGSKSPADVFFAENPPALQVLSEKGLLAPVPAATLAAVPRARSAPSGDWVAISARAAVLDYNTDKLTKARPAQVADGPRLARPGRVASRSLPVRPTSSR